MSTPKENIEKIFEQRKAKLYALALDYAGRAINKSRAEKRWEDRTFQAVDTMFAKAFNRGNRTGNTIGFLLAHGKQYGVYLELANDRKYEILRPVVEEQLGPQFLKAAQEIY